VVQGLHPRLQVGRQPIQLVVQELQQLMQLVVQELLHPRLQVGRQPIQLAVPRLPQLLLPQEEEHQPTITRMEVPELLLRLWVSMVVVVQVVAHRHQRRMVEPRPQVQQRTLELARHHRRQMLEPRLLRQLQEVEEQILRPRQVEVRPQHLTVDPRLLRQLQEEVEEQILRPRQVDQLRMQLQPRLRGLLLAVVELILQLLQVDQLRMQVQPRPHQQTQVEERVHLLQVWLRQ